MLMALSALTHPGFPGSAPGAVGLVSAAVGVAPAMDYILDVSPTILTQRYFADPGRGAVTGDLGFGSGSVSEYWQGELLNRLGLLYGGGNSSAAEAASGGTCSAPCARPRAACASCRPSFWRCAGG